MISIAIDSWLLKIMYFQNDISRPNLFFKLLTCALQGSRHWPHVAIVRDTEKQVGKGYKERETENPSTDSAEPDVGLELMKPWDHDLNQNQETLNRLTDWATL